jgi:hypothetical protein
MMKKRLGKCEECNEDGKVILGKDKKLLCIRCYNRKWSQRILLNPLKRKEIYTRRRIWSFLYGKLGVARYDFRRKRWATQDKLGFFASGGCCWICGEIELFSLETHHITKREKISLCGSCHQILHRMGWLYLLLNRGRM